VTAKREAVAATVLALEQLLTRAEVCRWLGISRTTSYRLQGSYLPMPLRIAPGVIRWRRSEIEALLRRAADDRAGRSR
jgi:predicted DNA-binding transcriptional regulator AlpA